MAVSTTHSGGGSGFAVALDGENIRLAHETALVAELARVDTILGSFAAGAGQQLRRVEGVNLLEAGTLHARATREADEGFLVKHPA